MHDYEIENQVELDHVGEDSDDGSPGGKRTSFDEEAQLASSYPNGVGGSVRVKKERVKSTPKG